MDGFRDLGALSRARHTDVTQCGSSFRLRQNQGNSRLLLVASGSGLRRRLGAIHWNITAMRARRSWERAYHWIYMGAVLILGVVTVDRGRFPEDGAIDTA